MTTDTREFIEGKLREICEKKKKVTGVLGQQSEELIRLTKEEAELRDDLRALRGAAKK